MPDDHAEKLRAMYEGPMSPDELEFLEDVKGLITFAERNGLSLTMVIGSLLHDLKEIVDCGFDLAKARSKGFLPMVTGYAKLTEDSVGQPDEALESK